MKILIYALHPISYQTPIFRYLSKIPGLDILVLFGSDLSLRKVFYDHLQKEVLFNNNLYLDEYKHVFLKNFAYDDRKGFFSRINPGCISQIKSFQPDFVLIHGYETLTSWLIYIYCVFKKIKLIFRGEAILGTGGIKRALINSIKNIIMPFYFNRFSRIIYSCNGNKEYFLHHNYPAEKLISMPCSVDNSFIREWINKNQKRIEIKKQELKTDKYDLVVIFPARFTMRKRPLDLIHGISKVNGHILAIFCGDGPLKVEMNNLCDKLNINYLFTGFIDFDELYCYFAISDIVCIPSEYDPSPKALNEALNFGLIPIVSNAVGTGKDLVKSNGYICNVGDQIEVGKILSSLVGNTLLVEKLKKESLAIINNYSIERSSDNLLANL